VALDRPYVVFNVLAAPELSLEPYRWCYPVIGCAAYRGYYDRADAEREAARLRSRGYDVFVSGIPAYSTLGWFADPLLSSFIHWPEGLLAELIFHELTHQRLYIADDTAFNESFASAVGSLGAERWLQDRPDALAEYRHYQAYRDEFMTLVENGRRRLESLYDSGCPEAEQRAEKQRLMDELLTDYQRLREERWDGFSGYDRWVGEGFDNAKLATLRAYTVHQPAFEALFRREGGDFNAFYRAVETLADLPPAERQQKLAALAVSDG
jgi:predicted aminopeptidase